jgi:hypothetical protein
MIEVKDYIISDVEYRSNGLPRATATTSGSLTVISSV